MQSNFDRALSAVLKHEGGYVDHPKDPGGATNKGITLANFRRYVKPGGTKADLKKLTTEQAAVVYRRQYWDVVLGAELPGGVDYAVFDYGVNSGPARAVKTLQAIVGTTQDGRAGPKTLAAVRAMDAAQVVEALCDQRLAFVKRLRTWPTFGKGWTSRIAGVRRLALEMAAATAQPVRETPQQAPASDVPVAEPPVSTPAQTESRGFRPNWLKIGLWGAVAVAIAFAIL